jgi:hypothetical protein
MSTRKTRFALAALAATLAVAGVSPTADAARRAPQVSPVETTAPVLGLATPQAREVGGAGVPGYDNEKCESLERDLQSALDRVIDLTEAGDSKRASRYSALAGNIERQISENCLVVF